MKIGKWLLTGSDVLYRLTLRLMPSPLYNGLRALSGRQKAYGTKEQYAAIVRSYLSELGKECFEGRRVMEIGSGNQTWTARYLLKYGARQVVLVDPCIDLQGYESRLPVMKNIVLEPSDLNGEVARKYARSIDTVLSYQVLERINDIQLFMTYVVQMLSRVGVFFARVDVSDHCYHGIRHVLSRLHIPIPRACLCKHLEYSDEIYKHIHPHRRIFMNRLVLPEFLQTMDKVGLQWEIRGRYLEHDGLIHGDIRKRVLDKYARYTKAYWFAIKCSLR